ncbi:MAG: Ty1/Copia family ribonuclease HI [bacterium]
MECDNKSVLHLIANGAGFSGKSRHMRVRWHFVHEMLEEGLIKIVHVPGDDNPTDLLTKPMGGKRFRRLRSMILNEPEDDNNDSD